MSVPFPVSLEGARTAAAVPVDQPSDLSAALAALGLHVPRLVVVLVGGVQDPKESKALIAEISRTIWEHTKTGK